MANIYKGVGVSWGVGSTAVTTVFGTFKLQSRDAGLTSETEMLKDENGVTAAKVYFDQKTEATFEYCPTDASAGGAVAPTLPTIGAIFTVTDTTAATYIAGTTWLCDDVQVKSSNTSITRVTVKATKYPGITA